MPTSYHIFQLERFPSQALFETEEQLTLFDNDEQNMEVVSTKVSFAKDFGEYGLRKFDVMHDFLVKLKYPGRARRLTFGEYVCPYVFPCYIPVGQPQRFILVQTKNTVAKDFISRLNGRLSSFSAKSLRVDFEALRPKLPSVNGAWFSNMQASHLSTAGVFGSHVDRSDEFQHAEIVGKLKALIWPHVINGITFTMMITEEGGVVIYSSFATEEDALNVFMDMKIKLLDPVLCSGG
jgi:hypothetical protein